MGNPINQTLSYDITIVGGGLSGLTSSILLSRAGLNVLLIEKNTYPFHRVCGEYISNEVVDFLERNELLPKVELPQIRRFGLSTTKGEIAYTHLEMGGFGISRYNLDHHLHQVAINAGVNIVSEKVSNVSFLNNEFSVSTENTVYHSRVCIGAFGKRSNLDQKLNRSFFKRRSPYVGIKYHVKTEHPEDLIALHNFPGGYCGVSNVEDRITNICYLSKNSNLKLSGSIPALEQRFLHTNPMLKSIWHNAEFIWDRPKVINEISFESKSPVENHILMCGDSAGMITPLCGNGMAMAFRSALFVSQAVEPYFDHKNRNEMEKSYMDQWNSHFRFRLWYGRQVQKLFGNDGVSRLSVNLINRSKPISRVMIRNTHGRPF